MKFLSPNSLNRVRFPGFARFCFIISCMFVLSSTAAVAQFEGTVEMRISLKEGDTTSATTYLLHVKGNLLSADMNGPGGQESTGSGRIIFRGDSSALIIVSSDQKQYVVISMPKSSDNPGHQSPAGGRTSLHSIGGDSTILGYSCRRYQVTEGNRTSEIWATDALGDVYGGLAQTFATEGAAGSGQDWSSELASRNLFPMVVITSQNGSVYERQEVTRVSREPIPAATFLPPDGYERQTVDLNMDSILKNMQQQVQTGADTAGSAPDTLHRH